MAEVRRDRATEWGLAMFVFENKISYSILKISRRTHELIVVEISIDKTEFSR